MQVWKQKGEEYRIAGNGGWLWTSATRNFQIIHQDEVGLRNVAKRLRARLLKAADSASKQAQALEKLSLVKSEVTHHPDGVETVNEKVKMEGETKLEPCDTEEIPGDKEASSEAEKSKPSEEDLREGRETKESCEEQAEENDSSAGEVLVKSEPVDSIEPTEQSMEVDPSAEPHGQESETNPGIEGQATGPRGEENTGRDVLPGSSTEASTPGVSGTNSAAPEQTQFSIKSEVNSSVESMEVDKDLGNTSGDVDIDGSGEASAGKKAAGKSCANDEPGVTRSNIKPLQYLKDSSSSSSLLPAKVDVELIDVSQSLVDRKYYVKVSKPYSKLDQLLDRRLKQKDWENKQRFILQQQILSRLKQSKSLLNDKAVLSKPSGSKAGDSKGASTCYSPLCGKGPSQGCYSILCRTSQRRAAGLLSDSAQGEDTVGEKARRKELESAEGTCKSEDVEMEEEEGKDDDAVENVDIDDKPEEADETEGKVEEIEDGESKADDTEEGDGKAEEDEEEEVDVEGDRDEASHGRDIDRLLSPAKNKTTVTPAKPSATTTTLTNSSGHISTPTFKTSLLTSTTKTVLQPSLLKGVIDNKLLVAKVKVADTSSDSTSVSTATTSVVSLSTTTSVTGTVAQLLGKKLPVAALGKTMKAQQAAANQILSSLSIDDLKSKIPPLRKTTDKIQLARFTKTGNKKGKTIKKGSLPVCQKFQTGSGKKSIFVLEKCELRRLARKAGHKEAAGFNYNCKMNHVNWPYPCPRPIFKTGWRYRTQILKTLAAAGLQLRLLWASIRWDDMAVKPPAGGTNTISTESEITTTELLKRRDIGVYGLRSEFLVRKIVVPIGLPSTPKGTCSILP